MTKLQLENLKKVIKAFDFCVVKPGTSITEVVAFTTTLQTFGKTINELEKELEKADGEHN